ncbi:MAG: hypothetical protein ACYDDF_05605 [Thermoplasmatota archaeon]
MVRCEFCSDQLGDGPANVILLQHLHGKPDCNRQYHHLLDNLAHYSWTPAMSGGA